MRKQDDFAQLEIRRCFLTGFTLIELLMVISIVVLLMAILLPALQRIRKQARAVVCQANQKQWAATVALYAEDNQGRLPSNHSIDTPIWFLRGSFISKDDPNESTSLHAVDTEGIACCPMAVKPGRAAFTYMTSGEIYMEGTGGSTFAAWQMTRPGRPFLTSYGLNGWLLNREYDHTFRPRPPLPYRDIFSMKGRSNIPLLLDAVEPSGQPEEFNKPPRFSGHTGMGMSAFCINRHNGYINGLFLDWSVRRIGLKEVWTLKWHPRFDTAGPWTKTGGAQPSNWPEWMRGFKDY